MMIGFASTPDAIAGPLGRSLLGHLLPIAGERVLDVGCGVGATTRALARAVGPVGRVTGIDPSADALAEARNAAAAAGIDNVEFLQGNAGVYPFEPYAYDVIFSCIGITSFDGPEAAFANLRRSLSRQGRLGFVCWRSPHENEWADQPREAAASIISWPPAHLSEELGPFALSRRERLWEILNAANFVDVAIEPLDVDLWIERAELDEILEFDLSLLTGTLSREPDPHLLARLRAALRMEIDPHRDRDGTWLRAAAWQVHAR